MTRDRMLSSTTARRVGSPAFRPDDPVPVLLSMGVVQLPELRDTIMRAAGAVDVNAVAPASRDRPVSILLGSEVGDDPLPRRTVVVLVSGRNGLHRAVAAGAAAIVPADGPEASMRHILRAVRSGLTVMPTDMVSSPSGPIVRERLPVLNAKQVRLCRVLADGHTMAVAAADIGCSERHARRLLRQVWDQLGARNRVDGMVRLARSGVLERHHPGPARQGASHAVSAVGEPTPAMTG